MKTKQSKWGKLSNYISGQMKKPFAHPEFIMYFFVSILIVGGLGIYSSIYIEFYSSIQLSSHGNIIINMMSFFIAIIASSSVDLILEDYPEPIKRSMTMLGVSCIILGFILFIFSYLIITYNTDNLNSIWFQYCSPSIGVILSLSIWWLVNSKNTYLISDINASSPLGGNDTDEELATGQKVDIKGA